MQDKTNNVVSNPLQRLTVLISNFRQFRLNAYQTALDRKRGQRGLNSEDIRQIDEERQRIYAFALDYGMPNSRVDELIREEDDQKKSLD